MNGFYLMHREWMNHPVLGGEKLCRRAAWCWLIEHAAWRARVQRVGVSSVRVERGEYAVSVRYLANAWGWSKSSVSRFIARLKGEDMIGTRIGTESGTGITVISICNYDKYQAEPDESGTDAGTGGETLAGQQRDTGGTNKKERKKEKKETLTESAPFDHWWAHVPKKVGKGQARKAFALALKKTSLETLIAAIRVYGHACRNTEERYIAHPSTWLNGERWLDEESTGGQVTPEDITLQREAEEAIRTGNVSQFIAKHQKAEGQAA